MRRDQKLLVLGEVLAALNQKLGDDALGDIDRAGLMQRWHETIEAMTRIAATARAGLRVKASALVVFCARTDEIHKDLALSLASDVLGSAR